MEFQLPQTLANTAFVEQKSNFISQETLKYLLSWVGLVAVPLVTISIMLASAKIVFQRRSVASRVNSSEVCEEDGVKVMQDAETQTVHQNETEL